MNESIYNNAGMPSEQGAAPPSNLMVRCHDCGGTQIWKRTSASEIEVYHDCFSGKHSRECFAALTLERDTLKAERDEPWKHSEHWRNPETGQVECDCCCGWALDAEQTAKEVAALKAKVERLSAPVSDEEWTNVVVVSPQHDHRTWMERKQVDSIIAARASTPPPHPINDDEQRRKDAAWNDRAKARCVCGEMIAWYSGEYLHVAGRSKSCADGRLASPAHFLVGMPPAEPEWEKGA